MKLKKIMPLFAIALGLVLAVATSGFNEVPKDDHGDEMFTFQYQAPGGTDYTHDEVVDLGNWHYTSDATTCSGDEVKACKIFVPRSLVDDPDGSPSLPATFAISASSSSTDVYYVTTTSAGSILDGRVSNKMQ